MALPFLTLPVRVGGGLNERDSPEVLAEGEATVLQNVRFLGRGRWAPRKALRDLAPATTGDVCGIFAYEGVAGVAGVLLTWDSVGETVTLHTIDIDGQLVATIGTLAGWAAVAEKPKCTAVAMNRILFIAEETKAHGLTIFDPLDVLGSGAAGGLFQPTFDFTGDAAGHAPLLCRGVTELNNMLMAYGYGTEDDPDRPEILRFSYPGLIFDAEGVGDAGTGGAAGSAGLFDMEDAIPVGLRGTPIIGADKALGRLVVRTQFGAFAVSGFDRFSIRVDEIDPQRGQVATRAGCVAGGVPYWWSPLGPCRWPGQMEDLTHPILPRLETIDTDSMFAVHAAAERMVYFVYALATEAGQEPNQVLGFHYPSNQWVHDVLGQRVFCGGTLRGEGSAGPAADPSALTHTNVSSSSAKAGWTNGDTAPGVVTKVYRAPDNAGVPGAYALLATLTAGVSSYTHTELAAGTTYWTKVQHERNGQASAAIEASFTTATDPGSEGGDPPAAPQNLRLTLNPHPASPTVLVAWDLGESGVRTTVSRRTGLTPYDPVKITAVDATSWTDPGPFTLGETYYYVVSHEKDGVSSGDTGPETVTIL